MGELLEHGAQRERCERVLLTPARAGCAGAAAGSGGPQRAQPPARSAGGRNVDPLLAREQRESFLQWLNTRASSGPVSVLMTIRWHGRDRSELTERYRAGTRRARRALPKGVVPRWLCGTGEVVFWLRAVQMLIVGDRLLGAPGAGLQLGPEGSRKQERARLAAGAVVCSLEADTGDATSAPVLWAPASFV